MLSASHELKSQANTLFARQDFSSAISTYDRALAELPNYLDYEMAVLQSNIAACHLRLEQWKDAMESCERGLEGLEREIPTKKKKDKTKDGTKDKKTADKEKKKTKKTSGMQSSDTDSEEKVPGQDADADTVVELPSTADEATALAALNLSDTHKADITRIRVKLLLRRARARTSLPPTTTFSSLSSPSPDALRPYQSKPHPQLHLVQPLRRPRRLHPPLLHPFLLEHITLK